jgi:hypothetical protein
MRKLNWEVPEAQKVEFSPAEGIRKLEIPESRFVRRLLEFL